MRIVVTGASGFVGTNLMPYLEHFGMQVLGADLRTDSLLDYSQIAAFVHLAGKAHDTANTSEAEAYFSVNVGLTKLVFKWFLESDARDFIFVSSVKAVADSLDNNVLTEETEASPATPHGQSKLMAEQYILAQSLPSGKRVFILRPCMIHGPGNKGNLNLLYKFVAKGIPYPLAAFENKRSFLSVENLCFAVKEILQRPQIPAGIYNLADDEALSTNDVVSCIATSLGKQPNLLRIPQGLLKSMAKIGDAIKLPLNSERLKKLTENYVVSNAKIKTALGISSFPITAREGLYKTIKSFC